MWLRLLYQIVLFIFFFYFCREFYYIQMEKHARQALSEGIKSPDDIVVTMDSELIRVLNLHYNRNNHLEVSINPLLPIAHKSARIDKISILKLEGIIKIISYERRDYESVDEKKPI